MDRLWKVIIADDEPIIREGIRDSIDWEALQLEVVGEAEDGEEALALAISQQVHILLVDINMPIMDGLTLIKHVREKLPDCRMIIITGHDEFQYAREAIRFNVAEYILKPTNPAQLRTVLEKVRAELGAEQKQREHLQLASEQISKNLPVLRERFCLEWIAGNLTDVEVKEQLHFLDLPCAAPSMIVVIRWPELSTQLPLMSERDRQLLSFAMENISAELLQEHAKVIFRDASHLLVILLWEDVLVERLADIEGAIQSYLKIAVYLHAESIADGFADVPEKYQRCRSKVYAQAAISPTVRRARQLIQEQFCNADLTLERVAALLQVSPVYLSRIIKQELGLSFVQLVTQLRIKKAVQLLNSTDLPIHEIASKTGYESQHYFSTAFKKVMGVSPNPYRRGAAYGEGAGGSRD